MATDVLAEEEMYEPDFGRFWWVFLITGTLWLILSLIIFRFDITSVKSIGYIAGVIFLFAAAFEFALVAGACAGALGILAVRAAELRHETCDHAVKVQAVVEAALRELDEVASGDRHLVGEELDLDVAERGLEERGRVGHGRDLSVTKVRVQPVAW